MIERTLRRLQAVEETMGRNQRSFQDPLTALSPDERTLIQAGIRGDGHGRERSEIHHAIMRRYLGACVERDRAMEEVGSSSVSDCIDDSRTSGFTRGGEIEAPTAALRSS
jgi:hypothetical protein